MSGLIYLNSPAIISAPSQKVTYKEKNEDWGIENIEYNLNISCDTGGSIRKSLHNKKVNYDLFNGKMNYDDFHLQLNKLDYEKGTFPTNFQNYPIELENFNILVGEEESREFMWAVRSLNEDVVTNKQEQRKQAILEAIVDEVKNGKFDPNLAAQRLQSIEKFYAYDYKDLRERMATHLLNWGWRTLDMKRKFSRGFYDVLIAAEEIYGFDIVAGNRVVFRKVNPLDISTIRSGDSPYIEDSDVIVEDSYRSIGQVIDDYYDELTPDQVQQIESGMMSNSGSNVVPMGLTDIDFSQGYASFVSPTNDDIYAYGGAYDSDGNIRVARVCWKSKRKVGVLTYYDEDGVEQKDFVDERYKAVEQEGESVEWYWVNEWWEGTKIGTDIYVKIQQIPFNQYGLDDLELKTSPYIGTAYNVNSSEAVSLMDRIKASKYQYNLFRYLIEIGFSKNIGKVMEVDISKKPDGWTTEKWLYFIRELNMMVVDPFAEVTKGVAQGKAAYTSNFAARGSIDMEMGSTIQHYYQMLNIIKQEISEIAGIPPQRKGAVSNRETVGAVERVIQQSSYITEDHFDSHDYTKVRCMRNLLEVYKISFAGSSKKLSYISDNAKEILFSVDGDFLYESDFAIDISSNIEDRRLLGTIKNTANISMQNGRLDPKEYFGVMASRSISEMRTTFDINEMEKSMEQQQLAKEQNETMAAIAAAKDDLKKFEIESKERMKQLEMQILDKINQDKVNAGIQTSSMMYDIKSNQNMIDDKNYTEKNEIDRMEAEEKERSNRAREASERATYKQEP